VPGFHRPAKIPYDPEQQRETLRGWLAIILIAILCIEIVLAFVLLHFSQTKFENVREVLGIVFGATVTLVGTALGFYFGEKKGRDLDKV
jgi:hypothetical protein